MSVQWWLAKVDQHGNPTLTDGAHIERSGADEAMILFKRLGLTKPDVRYMVAKVELSEPRELADPKINEEAIATINAARAFSENAKRRRP